MQSAEAVFIVRPDHFGFNPETAESNPFQKKQKTNEETLRNAALAEFNHLKDRLDESGIVYYEFESKPDVVTPDAVFPNNWISTHPDGKIILYPMLARNRRMERNPELVQFLKSKYQVKEVIDLSGYEKENQFLEGTGSLVIDHQNNIIYANISPRTHPALIEKVAQLIGAGAVVFEAFGRKGEPIYHTNVVMTIGSGYAVVCLDAIENTIEKQMVRQSLEKSGHQVLPISFSQMMHFAGNMLEVQNRKGELYLLMSETAHKSLSENQLKTITKFAKPLPVSIPTIEKVGGGSIRCMLAGIHFSR